VIEIDFGLIKPPPPPPHGFPWRKDTFRAKSGDIVHYHRLDLELGIPRISDEQSGIEGRIFDVTVKRFLANTHFTFAMAIESNDTYIDEHWYDYPDDDMYDEGETAVIACKRFLWKKVPNKESDPNLNSYIDQFAAAIITVVYGRQVMMGKVIPDVKFRNWE